MIRYLIALLAGLLAAQASANGLTPHEAEYKVKISVLGGRLTTALSNMPDGYAARHVIEPQGFAKIIANGTIDEQSWFAVDDAGVSPQRYRSIDQISSDKTDATVRFDRVAQQITGNVNGSDVVFPLDGDVYDRVSIQYQLMHALANGRDDREYTLYDIDELKHLDITFLGERRIDTPSGSYDAIGVQHQSKGSSRITTLWCAEALDFLPVLIEQHKDGKLRLRASLERYEPTNSE
jgi:hypothetical protein